MKIIKFKPNAKFKYQRKILIRNLVLNISIGIHNFEKKKKQKVRFNIEITTNPNISPSKKDMSTILNYETIVNKVNFLVNKKHHDLLEELAENIFDVIFKFRLVKKVKIKIEKLEIIKETESVGINVSKTRV